MQERVVFIRSSAIGDLIDGSSMVTGITVQLYFWAKIFVRRGWTVYSMCNCRSYEKDGIHFLKYRSWGKLDIIHEWIHTLWICLRYRPEIFIERGAGRTLYPMSKLARLFGIKSVLFGASDVNFEPGKEQISGGERNRRLYQKGVSLASHIVAQNKHQYQTLYSNYGRKALVLHNIWERVLVQRETGKTDVIWVANMRPLKRPEWLLSAARALPEYCFTIVGGPANAGMSYYYRIKEDAEKTANMQFMGSQSFLNTCALIAGAKILVCTSEFEGFPNTFLQAWSYGIPVVSTVDPSDIIAKNNLGVIVRTEEGLIEGVRELLENKKDYFEKCDNVKRFFSEAYSADDNYEKLIGWIFGNQDEAR